MADYSSAASPRQPARPTASPRTGPRRGSGGEIAFSAMYPPKPFLNDSRLPVRPLSVSARWKARRQGVLPRTTNPFGNVGIEPKVHQKGRPKAMDGRRHGTGSGSYAYDAFGAPIPRNSTRGNSHPVPGEVNTNVAASTAGYLSRHRTSANGDFLGALRRSHPQASQWRGGNCYVARLLHEPTRRAHWFFICSRSNVEKGRVTEHCFT